MQDNENRFRAIFEHAPIGLAEVTPEGRFMQANRSFCSILGYSREELLERTYLDITHPDDRAADQATRKQLLAGPIPFVQWEKRYVRKDGSIVWVNLNLRCVRDEAGRTQFLLAAIESLGALGRDAAFLRRKAKRALQESEQRFRVLFDNAVDGIFIADREGVYTDANRSACRILGYTRDELVGRRIADLLPENDKLRLAGSKAYLQQNLDHVEVAEWELKRKDGLYVPVEIGTRILQDGRWMAIVRDISERKRTQKELERYAAEVRDLYDNAPCGYHSLDREGVFLRINRTGLDWLGYAAQELIGVKKVTDLLTEESRGKFLENFPKFLRTGKMQDLEFEFVRKDGSILPVLLSATGIFDDEGKVVSSRTTMFDITDTQEARKKLRHAAAVFEHTNDAILIADAEKTIVAVNRAFTRMTGYRFEEVVGKNPRILHSERQDNEFYRNLWSSLMTHGVWQGEIWDRTKSGETFPVWESITVVKDEKGKITDYISVFFDITTIKEAESKLVRLAYQDPLTGLPNRLLYNDRLAHALAHAKRHDLRVALLLLDLDRFKLVNDTLGHSAGDELLQAIASRLKEAVRAEDTVARLGGDEFAIILSQLQDASDAALLAEKVVHIVSRPLQIAGQSLVVSASIGIGIYPDDAEDAETLAKVADTAMYGAKSKGRNAYEFYRREMTAAATEMLAIDRGLRNAIDHAEFVLRYQPKIDLTNGRIAGLEALIRWASPTRGLQMPERFIHVAEETSLIDRIGDWVLDAVCLQIRKWRDGAFPPVRVAVNVSARQLKQPGFAGEVRRKLAACSPLDGFGLDLEITETALQTEVGMADCLKELKSLGLSIAVDDFGTGFSSLNALKHLPVDALKIDRSFVHAIPATDETAIASAIIAMGHSLGMNIVAEGVETQEQLQFVIDRGCDAAQGYLFFPPLSPEECEPFLRQNGNAPLPGRSAASGLQGLH